MGSQISKESSQGTVDSQGFKKSSQRSLWVAKDTKIFTGNSVGTQGSKESSK